MAQELRWNESEFEIVMNSHGLPIEDVMQKLQRCRPEVARSRDAIEIVTEGIHRFHMGKENCGILSRMMINMLKEKQHPIRCPKCGIEF